LLKHIFIYTNVEVKMCFFRSLFFLIKIIFQYKTYKRINLRKKAIINYEYYMIIIYLYSLKKIIIT